VWKADIKGHRGEGRYMAHAREAGKGEEGGRRRVKKGTKWVVEKGEGGGRGTVKGRKKGGGGLRPNPEGL
jgi:hypothetical protein